MIRPSRKYSQRVYRERNESHFRSELKINGQYMLYQRFIFCSKETNIIYNINNSSPLPWLVYTRTLSPFLRHDFNSIYLFVITLQQQPIGQHSPLFQHVSLFYTEFCKFENKYFVYRVTYFQPWLQLQLFAFLVGIYIYM